MYRIALFENIKKNSPIFRTVTRRPRFRGLIHKVTWLSGSNTTILIQHTLNSHTTPSKTINDVNISSAQNALVAKPVLIFHPAIQNGQDVQRCACCCSNLQRNAYSCFVGCPNFDFLYPVFT